MTTSKLLLPTSTLLQEAAPKIISILSSHLPQHHFPILTQSQLASIAQQPKSTNQRQRRAAVLIPILDLPSSSSSNDNTTTTANPSILFTLRSQTLTKHPNEICFPGGHHDKLLDGDSLTHTALREATEELSPTTPYNLHTTLQILGRTAPVPSLTGTPVTPFLAVLPHTFPDERAVRRCFPGNPHEVARVFCVSVRELLACEGWVRSERWGGLGPVYETEYGRIWGLTAVVLRPVLHGIFKPVFVDG